MSKKVCITFSVILFIILAALMYCEATHPAQHHKLKKILVLMSFIF